ncbi:hypothetical protein YC2023_031170 [Brassica napus]
MSEISTDSVLSTEMKVVRSTFTFTSELQKQDTESYSLVLGFCYEHKKMSLKLNKRTRH